MKNALTILAAASLIIIGTGCASTGETSKGTTGATIGAVVGAGLGAIIGHQTGNRDAGALIGGAVGGLGGYGAGRVSESNDNQQSNDDFLKSE